MFEATLKDSSLFKGIVESIKELVVEANAEVKPEGIFIQAMDTSHVALISVNLKAEGFASFNCSSHMTLGINMQNLSKIMKLSGSSDSVTLKANQDASNLLLIFADEKSNKKVEFDMHLLTLETEALTIPELDYEATITMSAKEFAELCRDMHQVTETVAISTAGQKVRFLTESDIGKANTVLENTSTTKVEVTSDVNLSFSLRCLNQFNKAACFANEITIKLANSKPLLVRFLIGDLGELKYYLAPKMSESNKMEEEKK
jgi:proliferating cell nuclear antigen